MRAHMDNSKRKKVLCRWCKAESRHRIASALWVTLAVVLPEAIALLLDLAPMNEIAFIRMRYYRCTSTLSTGR